MLSGWVMFFFLLVIVETSTFHTRGRETMIVDMFVFKEYANFLSRYKIRIWSNNYNAEYSLTLSVFALWSIVVYFFVFGSFFCTIFQHINSLTHNWEMKYIARNNWFCCGFFLLSVSVGYFYTRFFSALNRCLLWQLRYFFAEIWRHSVFNANNCLIFCYYCSSFHK